MGGRIRQDPRTTDRIEPTVRRTAPALFACALGLAVSAAIALPAAPASAACASDTHKTISGIVAGQDDRDVNVSIGFDVVDSKLRAINAAPGFGDYGCLKNGNHGGYSVPQKEYNHFVSGQGVARGSRMKDGNTTTRAWTLTDLPSNAMGVWIEVYTRGYTGSPCRDSHGNFCFNATDTSRYGFANRHYVPVGARSVPLRLPLACSAGGSTGVITGRTTDASGRPTTFRSVYAWTMTSYNQQPSLQGWGTATLRSGSYTIPSLASGQKYVVWAQTAGGATLKRTGVVVNACGATPLSFRG